MVKKNIKKIEFKKIVTTALIAVMGLFALVAMKPMYKNFPAVGELKPPIVVPPNGPDFLIKVINNTGCDNLSFDLGFKASQTENGPLTNENVFKNWKNTKSYYWSDFVGVFGTEIDYNQEFWLREGGIDINIGTEIKMNLTPGQSKSYDIRTGPEDTDPCHCFNAVWDEAAKTITISSCQ